LIVKSLRRRGVVDVHETRGRKISSRNRGYLQHRNEAHTLAEYPRWSIVAKGL